MKNPMRVLVIERDVEKLHRITSVLDGAHYEVLSAGSFKQATEALQVQRFDAVLVGTAGNSEELVGFTTGMRNIERNLGIASKTPVLLCSGSPGDTWQPSCDDGVDAYLPEEFVAATFTDAVVQLAKAVSPPLDSIAGNSGGDLPVFEPEKFKAQVAYDNELLIEIIDIFLSERPAQVNEMRAALAKSDFARLGRVAHTMKGSLATLYAGQGRAHAQELELAAKAADVEICRSSLALLERDLHALESQLITLRDAVNR